MTTPNSEQEFCKLQEEIMNRYPMPELSPAEIRFYAMIGDALELVEDRWVMWLNYI